MELDPVNGKNHSLEFSTSSQSHVFLLGKGSAKISDVEMIYTSLRDILPPFPAGIMSPPRLSSWTEIPIRNQLVKHAAMAYLHPMSTASEVGGKGVFGRFKDWFCGGCGCLLWVNVVWRSLKLAFRERGDEIDYDDDEEDEEDD